MVIVGGDRGDLSVRHRNLRVEGGEFQMLLVLLRAIVPPRKREDQRIIALQFAQLAQRFSVIGQFVVGENASGGNVRTHVRAPAMESRASGYFDGSVILSVSCRATALAGIGRTCQGSSSFMVNARPAIEDIRTRLNPHPIRTER